MKESKFSNIIWGIVFLGLGIIFLGNNINLWDIDVFFVGWWTLFIIVPSVIGLFKSEGRISSLCVLVIGILLLLACQDIITFSLIRKLILPIIFIFIGITILFRPKKITDENFKDLEQDSEALELVAVFSGREERVNGKFKGANCISVFGGIDLDLRDAKIKGDIVIDAVACFGGIDILLPYDVNVVTSGIPFLGGVESRIQNKEKSMATVYINYVAVFGGIDIK
ncbi:MAG: hypothetical protein J6A17_04750 [Bacilli bacterium]|nr:hypothetical protein [Bacilli bacterium]